VRIAQKKRLIHSVNMWRCNHGKIETFVVREYVYSKTIHPDCPLDKDREETLMDIIHQQTDTRRKSLYHDTAD